MLASSLGLKRTLFLWGILDNSLGFVIHSSAPCLNPQPAGAQSSLGSLVHPVIGVYFLTFFLETLQTSFGHLEHLVLVVYPEVSSSHFSSTSVLQATTSSSTS